MRDYLAGIVFGATLTAGIVFGPTLADATPEAYGNFVPTVRIDSSRVEVIQECGDPNRDDYVDNGPRKEEDDPDWDCRIDGNGQCGE